MLWGRVNDMKDCIGWAWLGVVVWLRVIAAVGRACFRPVDCLADLVDEWGFKREAKRDESI